MKGSIINFSLLFVICAGQAEAQNSITREKNNDAQLWQNIYLEKNISPKIIAHLNQEARITENISQFHYNYFDLGATYKIKKWIRFSADYVFLYKKNYNMNNTDFRNSLRHQVYFDIVLRKKFHHFTFSDRNMFQWEWDDIYSTAKGKVSQLYYRNKLTVKYNTKTSFSPYVAEEQYLSMVFYDKYGDQFDRSRYFLGFFYSINAVNEIEGYYMLERHFNVNMPQTNWVIGIGYSHSFYSGGLMGKW